MSEVQKRYNLNKNKNLKNKINFVSLTVDPGQDTPEVLKRHAIDKKLDLSNWHFLTGSQAELEQVIVSQMKIHMGDKKFEKYEKPDLYDISHMSSLALFDQEGRLRGLFKTDPTGLANLVRAANLLIKLNG